MIDRELNYGRNLIEKFLRKSNGSEFIIDLGAGSGQDLQIAKNIYPNANLHAIEVYEPYRSILKNKGFFVHSINIEKDIFPFADKSVDIIIANQILEHLKEIFWVFHQATRILKKGGSFIIGVPNIAALHNRLLLLLGRQPSQLKNWSAHVRGWSKSDLLNFIKNCYKSGYTLKDFGGSNFYPFPPIISKPLAKIFPNLAWGSFFHLIKKREYLNEFIEYPLKEKLETNFYLGK
jgi:SAM-dependent methyltransferase